ncbi:MAG: putative tau-tubulin kinase 1 [Streblomastix strix]|uniref:Putative tau-tubulin kinase 1 n=1 Tax=Streblomastix strix TaxID=222440 RepID=A0A5J4W5B2_9EUKA|nr:MAG: putative tau-tubulin kinase 1 [Streblomastix strix]
MSAADPPSTKTPFRQGDAVKGHYVLGPEVGSGSFGQIFSASTISEGVRTFAFKFENIQATQPQLMNEAIVMRVMEGNKHFTNDIVNRKPPYRLSLHSVLKIGVQRTEALMALHQAGFVHRDIKPTPLNVNFRGILRYASLQTHHGFDLSRNDDLISLLYVLIELRTGKLPWTSMKTKV